MKDEWVSIDKSLEGFSLVLSEVAKQMRNYIEAEKKKIEDVVKHLEELKKQHG
jgi:pantothenate kinase